jgi:hypothetical protein
MCLPDAFRVVVLLVDLDLIVQLRDVRHVDLDRAVAERLHELVVLQLAILGLVGVPDDDLVDVGLRELLGLDLVFLEAPSRSYRNATSSFSTSTNSIMPRLATLNSPSKLNARGSESEPYWRSCGS